MFIKMVKLFNLSMIMTVNKYSELGFDIAIGFEGTSFGSIASPTLDPTYGELQVIYYNTTRYTNTTTNV
jgi:hypothetical protein